MPTHDDIHGAARPEEGIGAQESGRCAERDDARFDLFASHNYENPDFFHPKEISQLTMAMTVQLLPLIARPGRLTTKHLKRAQHLAALIISLSIDDQSMRSLFEQATTFLNLDADVLLQARRRLAETIGSGGYSGEPIA